MMYMDEDDEIRDLDIPDEEEPAEEESY